MAAERWGAQRSTATYLLSSQITPDLHWYAYDGGGTVETAGDRRLGGGPLPQDPLRGQRRRQQGTPQHDDQHPPRGGGHHFDSEKGVGDARRQTRLTSYFDKEEYSSEKQTW